MKQLTMVYRFLKIGSVFSTYVVMALGMINSDDSPNTSQEDSVSFSMNRFVNTVFGSSSPSNSGGRSAPLLQNQYQNFDHPDRALSNSVMVVPPSSQNVAESPSDTRGGIFETLGDALRISRTSRSGSGARASMDGGHRLSESNSPRSNLERIVSQDVQSDDEEAPTPILARIESGRTMDNSELSLDGSKLLFQLPTAEVRHKMKNVICQYEVVTQGGEEQIWSIGLDDHNIMIARSHVNGNDYILSMEENEEVLNLKIENILFRARCSEDAFDDRDSAPDQLRWFATDHGISLLWRKLDDPVPLPSRKRARRRSSNKSTSRSSGSGLSFLGASVLDIRSLFRTADNHQPVVSAHLEPDQYQGSRSWIFGSILGGWTVEENGNVDRFAVGKILRRERPRGLSLLEQQHTECRSCARNILAFACVMFVAIGCYTLIFRRDSLVAVMFGVLFIACAVIVAVATFGEMLCCPDDREEDQEQRETITLELGEGVTGSSPSNRSNSTDL